MSEPGKPRGACPHHHLSNQHGKRSKKKIEDREQVCKAKAEQERCRRLQEEREQASRLDYVFNQYCESYSHKKSLKDEVGYYKNWISPEVGIKRLDEIVLLDLERIRKKMTAVGLGFALRRDAEEIKWVSQILSPECPAMNQHKQ